jgi:AcrR family transcriptional regulator
MATKIRRTRSEERILAAARELFYEKGLRAVGVDLVIEASGVAKSTLYAHFRTKDELIAAYLRATDDSWMAQLAEAAERAGSGAADQLVGLFDALSDAFDRHGFFGCPFVSAGVEAEAASAARAAAVDHTRRRQAWLTQLAQRAAATDPAALSAHIGLLIDGALAAGRLMQDRGIVGEAKRAAADAVRVQCAHG